MTLKEFENGFITERNWYPENVDKDTMFLPFNDKNAKWGVRETKRKFWDSNILNVDPKQRILYCGVFKHPKYGNGIFSNPKQNSKYLFETERDVKLSINRFYKKRKFAEQLITDGFLEIRMCTININPMIITERKD